MFQDSVCVCCVCCTACILESIGVVRLSVHDLQIGQCHSYVSIHSRAVTTARRHAVRREIVIASGRTLALARSNCLTRLKAGADKIVQNNRVSIESIRTPLDHNLPLHE